MLQDEQLESIIAKSIAIIHNEVEKIEARQEDEVMSKNDSDKIIDFLKTLIIVQKEKRLLAKEEEIDVDNLGKDEMDKLIDRELERMKGMSGNKT